MPKDFTLDRVGLGPVRLRVRHGGSGPAVLLLHGHPRTPTTWHRVAPLLAEHFTVACPGTRGYGESSKPSKTDELYSKRVMAQGCMDLMRTLDEAEFDAGNKVRCPTLALWAVHDDLDDLHGDVLGVWREWAHDVRGRRIESGHHMAEEASEALADELIHFFTA